MLIEDKLLKHWIDNFFGYGAWDARVWFVALEDGGGDLPEEVAEKLNWFYHNHPSDESVLCDIREFYRHVTARIEGTKAGVYKNLYEYRFDDNAMLSGVWKNLISFVHGYRGTELPDLLDYQKKFFALQSSKQEALIKLYPLPSPHNHAWYYSWLDKPQFPFLKSRMLYQQHVYENRMTQILEKVHHHKPEIVLMYGMSDITKLKNNIVLKFPEAKFRMDKAIKQKLPQHHYALCGETKFIITTQIPTLRHNRIETGFDWQMLGEKFI